MTRAIAAAAAALCACSSVNMFPPSKTGGGDDGHGGMMGVDGGVTGDGGGIGSGLVSGRVCLMQDLRTPTIGCAGSTVAGLTVTLGASAATTTANGGFTMAMPTGTNLVWTVSGTTTTPPVPIETSVMSFGATGALIPAIAQGDYESLIDTNGATFDPASEGSIVASVTEQGAPLSGEVGQVTPAPLAVLYDTASADNWSPDDTSTHGIVWATGVTAGTAQLSVVPHTQVGSGSGSGSGDGVAAGIVVQADAITFVQLDTP